MKEASLHKYGVASRLVLAIFFLIAGGAKVIHPDVYHALLHDLGISDPIALAVVFATITVELFLGSLCLLGLNMKWTLLFTGGIHLFLMLLFSVGVLYGLKQGSGYFGSLLHDQINVFAIIRHATLAALAFYLPSNIVS